MRSDGEIPAEKVNEAAEVVAEQTRAAREAGAVEIAAVATAAIRRAPNRGELAAAVEDAGGTPLWILSAEEEARFSFVGASRTLSSPPEGDLAVVDVGGGSTEIAVGALDQGVTWCALFEVGSGLLADTYLRSDPPTREELDAVERQVDEAFRDLRPPHADDAVAVGGTATSLRRMVGKKLTPKALGRSIETLAASPMEELASRHDLDPERVRLLPAGILILRGLCERLDAPLRVARGGLREGVVLELFERRRAAA
jgi:exopolyphosphatase/guanosine-5'-triphosphate,3'-diphosphate pyrophosphatase